MTADEFMVHCLVDGYEIQEIFYILKSKNLLTNKDYLVFLGFVETYMICE